MLASEGYLKFIFALVFVLALMLILSWLVRRFGAGHVNITPRNGDRRVRLVEQVILDPRRRLVLVQRDNAQHLILLGANGETVIETGIRARATKGRDGEGEDVDESRR